MTVTYNDLGISWGPAVHFLELWNEVVRTDHGLEVTGYAPSWTGRKPIVDPLFDLRLTKVPDIRVLRQIVWDAIVAVRILRTRPEVAYIRASYFHLFSLLALLLVPSIVACEINGSATHDSISSRSGFIRRKIAEAGETLLLRRSSVVFSVTDQLLKYCRSVNPLAAHVHVDNGVARAFFDVHREPADAVKFIYVGTFTPWDGAEKIIEIARLRPDLTFRMVGDGDRRAELERDAPENIEFRGWAEYSQLPREYAECNAGIVLYEEERHRHTSISSLKTREYLAAGLPIFSTRVTGQEFIEECGFGLLTSGDVEHDLDTFIKNHARYSSNLAEAAAERFRTNSWAAVAVKTVACLKETVAQSRRRAIRREADVVR
jgi:glycosyltransferase involved in cell wall biosynthesis